MSLRYVPCATVGEFIACAIRKELLHIWLQEDPSSFDLEVIGAFADSVCPRIAEDLVRLSKEWYPSLILEAHSPLSDLRLPTDPEAPQNPVIVPDELIESLRKFFETADFFEEPLAGDRLAELAQRLPPWFNARDFQLPTDSVFCLGASIAPVLLRAPRDSQQVAAPDSVDAQSVGSKEELVTRQLQQCRKRIFALERELVVRSRTEKEKVTFEQTERSNASARLMEINTQLEERLKSRTEELRKAGQKLIEAQRGMDHAKFLLEDKNKQIAKFEYKEQNRVKLQEEFQEREKDFNKRQLRLAIQEDMMKQRESYRIDQLQDWLNGKDTHELSEAGAEINTRSALENLEGSFETMFKSRQEKFDAALKEYEGKIEEKKNQYEHLSKDVLKAGIAQRAKTLAVDAAVQVAMDTEVPAVVPGQDDAPDLEPDAHATAAPQEEGLAGKDDLETNFPVMNEDDMPQIGRRASNITAEVEQEAVAAFNLGMQNARHINAL